MPKEKLKMFGELNYLILVKILQKYSGLYILVLVTSSSMRQILWIVSCIVHQFLLLFGSISIGFLWILYHLSCCRGVGVIGEQPVILPRTAFEYSSACPLCTPNGRMVSCSYILSTWRVIAGFSPFLFLIWRGWGQGLCLYIKIDKSHEYWS